MGTTRIAVECLECGKRFTTASLHPTCPGCGGADVDIASPTARKPYATRHRVGVIHLQGAKA